MSEARRTVRNAGWLMGQRAFHVVAAALFAVLVPRLMGPDVFGQYSLLTSVSMWFAMLSGLGAVSLMTRVVPKYTAAGDIAGLRTLFSSLLALRTGTGVMTAVTYLAIVVWVLGERDWVSAALIAAAVFTRTVGNLCFTLFLGLNQAARWGMGDLVRRILTLAGVLVGFPLGGLPGACAGFLFANVVVLIVGVLGARPYLAWASLDLRRSYLAPFLRTGTSFAAGNLLLALAQRSGETIVRLATSDYAEVGFFGAAYSIYLTGAHALWQGAMAFSPLLVGLLHQGQTHAVLVWLERLLKWMAIAASMALLATVMVGDDLVPLVLGHAYSVVGDSLRPLTLSLVAMAVCSIGRLAALVADRPGLSALAAGAELAVFWSIGPLLASRYGATGMAFAALAGTTFYGAVITWRTRDVLPYSLLPTARALGLSFVFLPLALLRGTLLVNVALLAVAIGGYAATLLWRRVVSLDELRSARNIIRT
jgi:O-antigen/teichoic acid export membrane protein